MRALDETHDENVNHAQQELGGREQQSTQVEQHELRTAAKRTSRPHVYELDPMRVVTAICVVGVHVLGFTFFLEHSSGATLLHGAILSALHFTRQVFMFFTAFALIYVYYGRPFSTKQFWSKRSMGVLLPYSLWSIIYTYVNTPKPFWPFVGASIFNILTGNASYQLYYILLSLQFYLILPFFLPFLKRIARHPWKTLSISFLVQLLFLYIDFHFVQVGPFSATPLGNFIDVYQDRFLLTYQFFFFLGAFAALYLKEARAFILQHGRLVVSFFLVVIAAFWGHYFLQSQIYHENNSLSVLQPSILIYSISIIALFSWLAGVWARCTNETGHPRGSQFWHTLSDTSFGLYLIHALVLNGVVLPRIVPLIPATWPSGLTIFMVWLLTVSTSLLMSLLFLRIPFVSRLVGRKHPKEAALLSRLWHSGAARQT